MENKDKREAKKLRRNVVNPLNTVLSTRESMIIKEQKMYAYTVLEAVKFKMKIVPGYLGLLGEK